MSETNTNIIKIKAVIFDFGNVIAGFDHHIACRRLMPFTTLSEEEIYELIFESGIEKRYDEGKISTEEFYQLVLSEIQIKEEKLNLFSFGEIWSDIFSINSDIEMMLNKINSQVKLLLLSNTNKLHWKHISRFQIMRRFFSESEELILSFRSDGFRKPDERIFLEGIRKSGYSPKEIIYVDDIPDYVEVFKKLGGEGIVYNCQTDSIRMLQNELSKYGIETL